MTLGMAELARAALRRGRVWDQDVPGLLALLRAYDACTRDEDRADFARRAWLQAGGRQRVATIRRGPHHPTQ